MDGFGKARISSRPGAESLRATHRSAARTGTTFETGTSRAEFAPFSEALFDRASLALRNFLFQFGQ